MKEEYEQKQRARLNEWVAQIEKLKAKAGMAEADAQYEYVKQIEELRSMQNTAIHELTEIMNAGDEAWEYLKAGMESARGSFGDTLKIAASRFN
jgi:hypothetical protein